MITKQELQRRMDAFLAERLNTPICTDPDGSGALHEGERRDIAAFLGVEAWRITMPEMGWLSVDDRGLPDESKPDDGGFRLSSASVTNDVITCHSGEESEVGPNDGNVRVAVNPEPPHRIAFRESPSAAPIPAAGPWISVSDRLPPSMLCVLAWEFNDGEHIAQWCAPSEEHGGIWLSSDGSDLERVTHWAEIVPPKESE